MSSSIIGRDGVCDLLHRRFMLFVLPKRARLSRLARIEHDGG
jgi:hypothetical protein